MMTVHHSKSIICIVYHRFLSLMTSWSLTRTMTMTWSLLLCFAEHKRTTYHIAI